MESILSPTWVNYTGHVVTKYGHNASTSHVLSPKISVTEAAHPVPDDNSVAGAKILAGDWD
jgi:glycerate-2-kinase